jgi:putative solute:sodium symporter small subunit
VEKNMTESDPKAYFKSSLKIVLSLLAVWAFVSFGCSIVWRDWMDINMPKIGGAPFGFWMAQQGSIITFVILLFIYKISMEKLDTKHGYDEDEA